MIPDRPGLPSPPPLEEVVVLACLVGLSLHILVNYLPRVFG